MIRRCELDRVLTAVRRTGVHLELEALLRPTGVGRPRALRVDVLLTGMILTVLDARPLTLVNVHRVLTHEIARSAQVAIGTRSRRSGGDLSIPITVRQVRYLLEALERRMAHTEGRAPDLPDADWSLRALALQRVLDHIVDASLPQNVTPPTAMALDGSAVESWAKGKRRPSTASPGTSESDDDTDPVEAPASDVVEEGYSFDPDATWGYRTRTYDNKSAYCFGYDLLGFVGVLPVGTPADTLPKLTWRFTLRPCGADVVDPSLFVLDRFAEAGISIDELLNDRGFSYKSAVRWAAKLRFRGIEQVFDMHENDRGVRDYHGIRLVDGWPHCPAMPDRLIQITRPRNLNPAHPGPRASTEDRIKHQQRLLALEEFRALIAERSQWAFRRVSAAKPDGSERWECPAQAGKLVCANCPMSRLLPDDTPEVDDPPDLSIVTDVIVDPRTKKPTRNPDLLCCRQRTITIPGKANAKLQQRMYWGSDEWIESYSRRTHVEGYFGNLKNPSTGNIGRGWCRVVGLVKTAILAACAIAATNIRLLRTWAERTGDHTDPLCAVDPPDHGFEEHEHDPETGGAGATSPPAAA